MSRLGEIARKLGRRIPLALTRPFVRPSALLFHGVERKTDDARVQTNHHEADLFYEIVKSLKADYELLPLGAIGHALREPKDYARAVFLMSDDGYANTLTVAADILQSLTAPWALFVSTRHIETRERNPMFLARLFLAFAPNGRYAIPHFGKPIRLRRQRQAVTGDTLDRLKALPADQAHAALGAMLDVVAHDAGSLIDRFRSESFLSWDDVKALKSRNVEIGAHAHVHWAMHKRQSRTYLREQAEMPRRLIEANVGLCRFFAYPFGNVNDVSPAAVQAVRTAGYEYAFTTLSGSIESDMNPLLLPRYTIGSSERRLSSVVPLLRAGNRRVRKWQRALGG